MGEIDAIEREHKCGSSAFEVGMEEEDRIDLLRLDARMLTSMVARPQLFDSMGMVPAISVNHT